MDKFAERLQQARLAKQWTQSQLAAAVGVRQSTIGNLEAGTRKNPRELLEMAAALGVSATWLKTGKGSSDAATLPAEPTTVSSAVSLLASLLDQMDEDQRAQVAQRVQILLQAPDSNRARDALVVELSRPNVMLRKRA